MPNMNKKNSQGQTLFTDFERETLHSDSEKGLESGKSYYEDNHFVARFFNKAKRL